MTILGRRDARFSSISRLRMIGSRYYAMGGDSQAVFVGQYSAGTVDLVGQVDVGSRPRDIAGDANYRYVLSDEEVLVISTADVPVISARWPVSPGRGRWILTLNDLILSPSDKGLECRSVAGVLLSTLYGAGRMDEAVLGADGYIYVWDAGAGRIHVVQLVGSSLTYVDSVAASNCREPVKMELDSVGGMLYLVNTRRVVRFSVDAGAVALSLDYGRKSYEYTDIQVADADVLWVGVLDDDAYRATPEYLGRVFGVWDPSAGNGELIFAAPQFSLFAISNVVPVWATDDVGDAGTPEPEPGDPDPVVPPIIVVPPPPVITSDLTASLIENTLFSYTITATGAGPITYGVTSPPSWLTAINPTTGAIAGTPTAAGVVNISITATNAGGTTTAVLVATVLASIGDNTGVSVNSSVEDVFVDGGLLYVVGSFTSVTDSSGTYTRNRAACLNSATGLWTAWNPNSSAAGYVVFKHGLHIYISTRTAAPTFGGVAVSYMARVDPTTGVRDATWAPTFDGIPRGMDSHGSRLLLCGGFTTVSGQARRALCSFTDTALDSWYVKTSDTPENLLTTHTGGAVPTVFTVRAIGGHAVFVAGSLRATRNAGGYWLSNWGSADLTTGVVIQSVNGVTSSLTSLDDNTGFVDGSGRLVCQYASDFGGTQISNHPTGVDSGKDMYAINRISENGTSTPAASLVGSVSAAYYGVVERDDGQYMTVGTFSSVGGNTSYRYAAAYNPTSGALDTGFTYRSRLNAAGQSAVPTMTGIKRLGTSAVVLYGSMGGSPSQQHDGTYFQGILIVRDTTGARL